MNVANDLFLPTPEEELEALRVQYMQAVAILREVKGLAHKFARSGNPGRADAGRHLLQLLEPQR